MFNIDKLLAKAYDKELLSEENIRELCARGKEILIMESNVRQILPPVTVVGDIHGQFFDLLEIFRIGGNCPDTNYCFLGDYVDRGHHSVETITLLLCLKVKYPDRVTLVRGNHESRAVTLTYGFYTECEKKFGNVNVWNYFTDFFDYLVLSVLIGDSILCVHGGLSPSLHSVDQIKVINRFREIPHEGLFSDLMWSDPISSDLSSQSDSENNMIDFAVSPRGAGYVFGKNCTKKFLEMNNLGHICRAHQLCMNGYQVSLFNKIMFDDLLSTVWSAPNYCYRAGNLASILEIGQYGERYYNVFGPCPDQQFESRISLALPMRLDELLDEDGNAKKKIELESAGLGQSHNLKEAVDFNNQTFSAYFT
jgi:serine/threonine-protein phosphatase PPG1